MPYMPSTITKRGLIAAAAALAALSGPVAAANAGDVTAPVGNCPLSQPFAAMGDPSFYTLSANGSLEQGTGGWLFNAGSKITSGDDPYDLTAGKDTHALSLPAGSSAWNLVTCQIGLQPPLRFAAINTGDQSAVLEVDALSGNPTAPTVSPIAFVPSTSTWQVVSPIQFAVPVGALGFRFTPTGGSWKIDDVYVDPYKRI
jgi:hypothetical protein